MNDFEIPLQKSFSYDVCLSFAGEDRPYVSQVAQALKERGITFFYDEDEQADLWGKDLYEHFAYIYGQAARYCILFASHHYARKHWTTHERENAQARALKETKEYILPARFDDTQIPGLPATVGYVNLATMEPESLAELISKKVEGRERHEFLPLDADVLCETLGIEDTADEMKDRAITSAVGFLHALRRTTRDERWIVMKTFFLGCTHELPENIHIDVDLLRRATDLPRQKIVDTVGGLRALGIYAYLRDNEDSNDGFDPPYLPDSDPQTLALEFHHTSGNPPGNATAVANAMVSVYREDFCEEHAMAFLMRLDFSQLSSKTRKNHEDLHEE